MSVIKTRGHQLFPVFDASQLDIAKRFASGPAHDFAPGEIVFEAANAMPRSGSCSKARSM